MENWVAVATWAFAGRGIQAAAGILAGGGRAADAAQIIAEMAEDDPEVDSVGLGGWPNIHGEVELDAAFMDGDNLNIGAVAALKGFRHPVAIARRVMEKSVHTFLAGAGAEEFAASEGFEPAILLTEASIANWRRRLAQLQQDSAASSCGGHDTIGVVTLDRQGHMCAATSTSGLSLKHRGRVGDSPLVGSGFYVDSLIGGAVATGVGEDIMKGCASFYAVQLLEKGCEPREAAEEAVRRLHRRLSRQGNPVGNIALVCVDRQGCFGGAANHDHFVYHAIRAGQAPVRMACVKVI